MRTTVNIIVFSLLCWCANAQNYLTMDGRTSSGYVVAHSGWSSDYELGYTDISISDLKKLTENIGKNPILANTNTYTSGYLVGMSGWSNDEIRKVNVSIADLLAMMKNYGKNPIIVKASDTYSSGYLVGMSGWNNDEIRKVNISIAELNDVMKTVKELKTENETLKKKIAGLEENQALIADFIGLTLPENDVQVVDVQAANIKVFVDDRTIILENIQGLPVTVYQLNGTILTSKTTNDNTLSIETPSAGVYIVLAGEEAVKVVVN